MDKENAKKNMKMNKISDATKILIFAATIVVVCVICALGFKLANEGKASVTSGTSKYNEMASNQDDTELMAYDGGTILGNQLVDLIKKTVDAGDTKYLCIRVKTMNNEAGADYNYTFIEGTSDRGASLSENPIVSVDGKKNYAPNTVNPSDKGNPNYVNLSSEFYGNVIKDTNGNIICLEFTQRK